MADSDVLGKMKLLIEPGSVPDETLQTLLKFAGRKVLNRAYPFREDITEVPERYKDVQVRAAVELFSKMGAEGQTSHSENSISRVWESADISNSVLAEIIPHAGVI